MTPRISLAEGAFAGALGVLAFHQPAASALFALGLFPVQPFDWPTLWRGLIWSAGWGALFVLALRHTALGRMPLALAGAIFTLAVPLLFLFLVIAPFRGFDLAYGMPVARIAAVAAAYVVWGVGMAVLLRGLRHAWRV